MSQTIAVFGATGQQGRAVVKRLLATGMPLLNGRYRALWLEANEEVPCELENLKLDVKARPGMRLSHNKLPVDMAVICHTSSSVVPPPLHCQAASYTLLVALQYCTVIDRGWLLA